MPHRSAANINNGVLIANTKLDDLSLHDGYVSVGAGLRWGAVFDYLETEGLAVVGGRVADVGVAGLILGGGLSTFSGKRGFACDNVKAFQVSLRECKMEICARQPELILLTDRGRRRTYPRS